MLLIVMHWETDITRVIHLYHYMYNYLYINYMCTQAHAYNLSYGKYYEGKVEDERIFS